MPETQTPVTIDQMPDYQDAERKIIALSQYPDQFRVVAEQLGLGSELEKLQAAGVTLTQEASALNRQQQVLDRRAKAIDRQAVKKAVIVGGTVIVGSGVIAGSMVGKKYGALKGTMAGTAAAIAARAGMGVTGFPSVKRDPETVAGLNADTAALNQQKAAFNDQQIDLGRQFAASMAERMLVQQQTLDGQGPDAHLVPMKDAVATSMADKYAVPPSADKVAALAQSAGSQAPQLQ